MVQIDIYIIYIYNLTSFVQKYLFINPSTSDCYTLFSWSDLQLNLAETDLFIRSRIKISCCLCNCRFEAITDSWGCHWPGNGQYQRPPSTHTQNISEFLHSNCCSWYWCAGECRTFAIIIFICTCVWYVSCICIRTCMYMYVFICCRFLT